MTFRQKLKLGPRHKVGCGTCGRKVSVSKVAILAAAVPVTIAAFLAHIATSLLLGSAALLIGGAAAISVYVFAVPIVGRDA